jgi:hypothetical protein
MIWLRQSNDVPDRTSLKTYEATIQPGQLLEEFQISCLFQITRLPPMTKTCGVVENALTFWKVNNSA